MSIMDEAMKMILSELEELESCIKASDLELAINHAKKLLYRVSLVKLNLESKLNNGSGERKNTVDGI